VVAVHRTTHARLGAILMTTGAMLIALAIVAPAANADPHGKALGWSNNHAAPTTSTTATSNGDGANVSGPYDPNGVGLPSGNGNGNGDANGKPCAGCVGNADGKNPPGQLPGGQDHNNGYECDGNHGVGRTNPAHSRRNDPGATTTTAAPPTSTTTVEATTTTTVEATTTTTEA